MRYSIRCALALVFAVTGAHAADDLTKPLRPSPDGHFLLQPDGAPFFWLGDTAWDLFQRPNRNEVESYLSDRQRKGFTIVQAVVGGVHDGPNGDGEAVFIDNDPAKPNPRYFDNVDWIVGRAAHYGIRVAMVPYWGGRLATNGIFTSGKASGYGRWLGQRYGGSGVVWILGGDSNPLWPRVIKVRKRPDGEILRDRSGQPVYEFGSITDFRPIYDALAGGIVAGEGGKPLITYHPSCCSFPGTPKPRTSLYFNDRDWLTMHMFQSSHYAHPAEKGAGAQIGFDFSFLGPFNYLIAADEYNTVPARPLIDGEARFEDLGVDNDAPRLSANGFWSGYDARNAAWHAVFAGAAGHTYGNHSVWQFYDPARNTADPPARLDLPWQKAIDRPAAGQLQYLKTLMLSRPYLSRVPDQSLIVGAAGEGTAHIGATRDKNGDYALLYLPQGQAVTVDLTTLSGERLNGWWYDPRTGSATRIEGDIPRTGKRSFQPPSSGAEDDWVLVLDNANRHFTAPGLTDPRTLTEFILKWRQESDELRKNVAQEMTKTYPVTISPEIIGGVQTDVVTPRDGVSQRNKNRVLINLHGGGMIFGARYEGQVMSIPIASVGKIKVVTVDYRMAPEHRAPAASEDVAAVYKELLKHYKPANIGIYGCSAGGYLTAASLIWFQAHGLPRPGAAGILCYGVDEPEEWKTKQSSLLQALRLYRSAGNPDDPLVFPKRAKDLLKTFPPTVFINSTKDATMGSAAHSHLQLLKAGVHAELYVWDGLPHAFMYNPLPESREVYATVVKFFDRHLGGSRTP